MSSSSEGEEQKSFSEGFHGLPSETERTAMSVLQLAELLVAKEKDSPAYIVLSHELNLKIAKLQAKATLNAGWLGAGATIIASIMTFVLGYYLGTLQHKEPNDVVCQSTSAKQMSGAPTKPVSPESHASVVPQRPLVEQPVVGTQKPSQSSESAQKPCKSPLDSSSTSERTASDKPVVPAHVKR